MTRVGKIARLPERIREQINCRLQDGEEGRKIISWLNSLDEVKAVLSASFDNWKITDGNLCEWKRGGYRDWETQQITLDEARRVMSEGGQLAKTGNKALADNLAVWLTGRYVVATRKLMENGDDPAAWKMLRELCHDVVALRRGDHGAEWLRIEREKLKLQRKKQNSDREKLKQEILEENPPRKVLSEEEKEQRWNEIFGINPDTYHMYQNKTPSNPEPDSDDQAAPPPEPTPAASVPNLNPNPTLNLPTPADDSSLPCPPTPTGPTSPTRPTSPEESEAQEVQHETELAEQGHALSAYSLGARYRDGLGVPKDLAKAREWLGKAASQGIGSAKIELRTLLMRYGD
ncbi:MAG: tetratricopeptide repeat protein [Limisphaerales bacterium]